MMVLFEVGLVVGLLAVVSNPSPYYAALGLVGSAGLGCLVLIGYGVSFLSLVLFLIYLGGMLVVFAYSAALVAELHPDAWGDSGVVVYLVVFTLLLGGWWMVCGGGEKVEVSGKVCVGDGGWFGVSMLYSLGGGMLLVVGWALLLTLFSVLEVVRGQSVGVLRAV